MTFDIIESKKKEYLLSWKCVSANILNCLRGYTINTSL